MIVHVVKMGENRLTDLKFSYIFIAPGGPEKPCSSDNFCAVNEQRPSFLIEVSVAIIILRQEEIIIPNIYSIIPQYFVHRKLSRRYANVYFRVWWEQILQTIFADTYTQTWVYLIQDLCSELTYTKNRTFLLALYASKNFATIFSLQNVTF